MFPPQVVVNKYQAIPWQLWLFAASSSSRRYKWKENVRINAVAEAQDMEKNEGMKRMEEKMRWEGAVLYILLLSRCFGKAFVPWQNL